MSPCRGVVIAVAAVATIVVVGATALAGLVAVGSACSGAASGRTTNNDDIININDFADPSRSSCQPVPPPPHHWHRKSDCVAWAAKARCEAHRLQLDNGDSEAKTEATANNNHDDDDDDDGDDGDHTQHTTQYMTGGRGQQLGCNRRDTTGHGSDDDDHPNNNYDTADRGSNDDDTDGGGGDAAGFCYTTREPQFYRLQPTATGLGYNRLRGIENNEATGKNRLAAVAVAVAKFRLEDQPVSCQSTCNKARQAVESETPSVPDSRKTPAAERHQPAKGKLTSKAQRGAPKVKLVAKSTDLTTGSDAEMESEPDNPSPAWSVPHKRSLPKSRDSSKDPATQIVEPVGKKPKVGVCTAPENPRVKIKKPIPPRSPLPQCTNRVVQPAKPDMPRPKRTSAQVAAAEAEKLEKEKKLALAELGLNEEAQDAVEERNFVQHFKDLPDVDKDSESEKSLAGPKDDALEAFPVDEDEPLVSQDGEDEALHPEDPFLELKTMPAMESGAAAGMVKKKKKPAKGETRKAVEAVMMNLRQEQEESLKRTGEKHEAAVSQGGLTGGTPTPQDDSVLPDNVLGGLANEDADSERPLSTMSKGWDVT
ncbi:hypothetical protein EDB89DRAFT_1906247 [Lactarius sanguifluus]|nr:hypothetical protein EDB89DRAFT_1906247 [Lactarius sanguifluus]